MFFDPPYSSKFRDRNLYHQESLTVAKDVEEWVLERGRIKDYRIIVAGYEDEYQTLVANNWTIYKWSANGGYSNRSKTKSENRHRERLFISPHCLRPVEKKQLSLIKA